MDKTKKQSLLIMALIIIIIVVSIIAALAIYDNRQKSIDKEADNDSKIKKNEQKTDAEKKKPVRTVKDWAVLRTKEYSTPMPDGWKLQNSIVDFDNTPEKETYHSVTELTLMKHSDLQYQAGTPATIREVTASGRSGTEPENSLLRMGYSDDVRGKIDEFKKNSDDSSEKMTTDGHTIYASVNTYKKDTPTIMMKIKAGTHLYMMVVKEKDSNAGVIIWYMVEPEMTDYSAQLQKGLEEIKFL